MPKPFKHSFEHDGETIEIDVTPPEGYLDTEEISERYVPKENINSMVNADVRRKAKEDREKLLNGEDEELVEQFRQRHGFVKPGEDPPDLDKRLKSAKEEWDRTELNPKNEQIQVLTEQNGRLLDSKLDGELVGSAAGMNVKKTFLQQGPGGSPPAFVNMMRPYFAYCPEHGYFAVIDGRDEENRPRFRVSGKTEQGRPYMGVAEYIEGWSKDKTNVEYIGQGRQIGPKLGDTEDAGGDLQSIPVDDLDAAGANLEGLASGEVTRE